MILIKLGFLNDINILEKNISLKFLVRLYQVGHHEKDAGNSKLYDSGYSKTSQQTQTPELIVNIPTHCPTVNTLT